MPPPPVPRRLVTRSSARNPLHATRSTQPTPRAKTALPAHDSPPTPALVRKTALPAHDSPRHQHWCAKRPSLLTIAPRHQQLVRKTAFPAHDSLRHQHWCAKTALPAHDRPPDTSSLSHFQNATKCACVCEHNHGSQLILHEYIKRTSSHPNRIGGRAFY